MASKTIQEFRDLNPNDKRSDSELTLDLGKAFNADGLRTDDGEFDTEFDRLRDLELPNAGETLSRRFGSGLLSLKSTFQGAGALGLDLLGFEDARNDLAKAARKAEKAIAVRNVGLQTDFTTARTPAQFANAFIGAAGEVAPSVIESVATGFIGAGIGSAASPVGTAGGAAAGFFGKQFVKKSIKNRLRKFAGKELGEEGLEEIAENSVQAGVGKKAYDEAMNKLMEKTGATKEMAERALGNNPAAWGSKFAVADSIVQNTGEVFNNITRDGFDTDKFRRIGSALGGGLIAGALDAWLPKVVLKRTFKGFDKGDVLKAGEEAMKKAAGSEEAAMTWFQVAHQNLMRKNKSIREAIGAEKVSAKSVASRFAKNLPKDAALEGITEGLQTIIGEVAHTFADPTYEIDGKQMWRDLVNSVVLGSIGGGQATVISSALEGIGAKKKNRDIDEQLEDLKLADVRAQNAVNNLSSFDTRTAPFKTMAAVQSYGQVDAFAGEQEKADALSETTGTPVTVEELIKRRREASKAQLIDLIDAWQGRPDEAYAGEDKVIEAVAAMLNMQVGKDDQGNKFATGKAEQDQGALESESDAAPDFGLTAEAFSAAAQLLEEFSDRDFNDFDGAVGELAQVLQREDPLNVGLLRAAMEESNNHLRAFRKREGQELKEQINERVETGEFDPKKAERAAELIDILNTSKDAEILQAAIDELMEIGIPRERLNVFITDAEIQRLKDSAEEAVVFPESLQGDVKFRGRILEFADEIDKAIWLANHGNKSQREKARDYLRNLRQVNAKAENGQLVDNFYVNSRLGELQSEVGRLMRESDDDRLAIGSEKFEAPEVAVPTSDDSKKKREQIKKRIGKRRKKAEQVRRGRVKKSEAKKKRPKGFVPFVDDDPVDENEDIQDPADSDEDIIISDDERIPTDDTAGIASIVDKLDDKAQLDLEQEDTRGQKTINLKDFVQSLLVSENVNETLNSVTEQGLIAAYTQLFKEGLDTSGTRDEVNKRFMDRLDKARAETKSIDPDIPSYVDENGVSLNPLDEHHHDFYYVRTEHLPFSLEDNIPLVQFIGLNNQDFPAGLEGNQEQVNQEALDAIAEIEKLRDDALAEDTTKKGDESKKVGKKVAKETTRRVEGINEAIDEFIGLMDKVSDSGNDIIRDEINAILADKFGITNSRDVAFFLEKADRRWFGSKPLEDSPTFINDTITAFINQWAVNKFGLGNGDPLSERDATLFDLIDVSEGATSRTATGTLLKGNRRERMIIAAEKLNNGLPKKEQQKDDWDTLDDAELEQAVRKLAKAASLSHFARIEKTRFQKEAQMSRTLMVLKDKKTGVVFTAAARIIRKTKTNSEGNKVRTISISVDNPALFGSPEAQGIGWNSLRQDYDLMGVIKYAARDKDNAPPFTRFLRKMSQDQLLDFTSGKEIADIGDRPLSIEVTAEKILEAAPTLSPEIAQMFAEQVALRQEKTNLIDERNAKISEIRLVEQEARATKDLIDVVVQQAQRITDDNLRQQLIQNIKDELPEIAQLLDLAIQAEVETDPNIQLRLRDEIDRRLDPQAEREQLEQIDSRLNFIDQDIADLAANMNRSISPQDLILGKQAVDDIQNSFNIETLSIDDSKTTDRLQEGDLTENIFGLHDRTDMEAFSIEEDEVEILWNFAERNQGFFDPKDSEQPMTFMKLFLELKDIDPDAAFVLRQMVRANAVLIGNIEREALLGGERQRLEQIRRGEGTFEPQFWKILQAAYLTAKQRGTDNVSGKTIFGEQLRATFRGENDPAVAFAREQVEQGKSAVKSDGDSSVESNNTDALNGRTKPPRGRSRAKARGPQLHGVRIAELIRPSTLSDYIALAKLTPEEFERVVEAAEKAGLEPPKIDPKVLTQWREMQDRIAKVLNKLFEPKINWTGHDSYKVDAGVGTLDRETQRAVKAFTRSIDRFKKLPPQQGMTGIADVLRAFDPNITPDPVAALTKAFNLDERWQGVFKRFFDQISVMSSGLSDTLDIKVVNDELQGDVALFRSDKYIDIPNQFARGTMYFDKASLAALVEKRNRVAKKRGLRAIKSEELLFSTFVHEIGHFVEASVLGHRETQRLFSKLSLTDKAKVWQYWKRFDGGDISLKEAEKQIQSMTPDELAELRREWVAYNFFQVADANGDLAKAFDTRTDGLSKEDSDSFLGKLVEVWNEIVRALKEVLNLVEVLPAGVAQSKGLEAMIREILDTARQTIALRAINADIAEQNIASRMKFEAKRVQSEINKENVAKLASRSSQAQYERDSNDPRFKMNDQRPRSRTQNHFAYSKFVAIHQPTDETKEERIIYQVVETEEGEITAPDGTIEYIKGSDYQVMGEDLGPTQRLGANLAIHDYVNGGRGIAIADGMGVGKTMEQLIIADYLAKEFGIDVIQVAFGRNHVYGSFINDAKLLGLSMLPRTTVKNGKHTWKSTGKVTSDDGTQPQRYQETQAMYEMYFPTKKVPAGIKLDGDKWVSGDLKTANKDINDHINANIENLSKRRVIFYSDSEIKGLRNAEGDLYKDSQIGAIIFDEAQKIKNPFEVGGTAGGLADKFFQLDAGFRVFATGTITDLPISAIMFYADLVGKRDEVLTPEQRQEMRERVAQEMAYEFRHKVTYFEMAKFMGIKHGQGSGDTQNTLVGLLERSGQNWYSRQALTKGGSLIGMREVNRMTGILLEQGLINETTMQALRDGIDSKLEAGARAKVYFERNWLLTRTQILNMKNALMEQGKFIRREYPYWGTIEFDSNWTLSEETLEGISRMEQMRNRLSHETDTEKGGYFVLGDLEKWMEFQKTDIIWDRMLRTLGYNAKTGIHDGKTKARIVIMSEFGPVNRDKAGNYQSGGLYVRAFNGGMTQEEKKRQGMPTRIGGRAERQPTGLTRWIPDMGSIQEQGQTTINIMPSMVDEISRRLKELGISFGVIAGDTPKAAIEKQFQNGEIQVLLATFESGSTGINLDNRNPDGSNPITMYVPMLPDKGTTFEQLVYRISRKLSTSKARVFVVASDDMPDDARRKRILMGKLMNLDFITSADTTSQFLSPTDRDPERFQQLSRIRAMYDNRYKADTVVESIQGDPVTVADPRTGESQEEGQVSHTSISALKFISDREIEKVIDRRKLQAHGVRDDSKTGEATTIFDTFGDPESQAFSEDDQKKIRANSHGLREARLVNQYEAIVNPMAYVRLNKNNEIDQSFKPAPFQIDVGNFGIMLDNGGLPVFKYINVNEKFGFDNAPHPTIWGRKGTTPAQLEKFGITAERKHSTFIDPDDATVKWKIIKGTHDIKEQIESLMLQNSAGVPTELVGFDYKRNDKKDPALADIPTGGAFRPQLSDLFGEYSLVVKEKNMPIAGDEIFSLEGGGTAVASGATLGTLRQAEFILDGESVVMLHPDEFNAQVRELIAEKSNAEELEEAFSRVEAQAPVALIAYELVELYDPTYVIDSDAESQIDPELPVLRVVDIEVDSELESNMSELGEDGDEIIQDIIMEMLDRQERNVEKGSLPSVITTGVASYKFFTAASSTPDIYQTPNVSLTPPDLTETELKFIKLAKEDPVKAFEELDKFSDRLGFMKLWNGGRRAPEKFRTLRTKKKLAIASAWFSPKKEFSAHFSEGFLDQVYVKKGKFFDYNSDNDLRSLAGHLTEKELDQTKEIIAKNRSSFKKLVDGSAFEDFDPDSILVDVTSSVLLQIAKPSDIRLMVSGRRPTDLMERRSQEQFDSLVNRLRIEVDTKPATEAETKAILDEAFSEGFEGFGEGAMATDNWQAMERMDSDIKELGYDGYWETEDMTSIGVTNGGGISKNLAVFDSANIKARSIDTTDEVGVRIPLFDRLDLTSSNTSRTAVKSDIFDALDDPVELEALLSSQRIRNNTMNYVNEKRPFEDGFTLWSMLERDMTDLHKFAVKDLGYEEGRDQFIEDFSSVMNHAKRNDGHVRPQDVLDAIDAVEFNFKKVEEVSKLKNEDQRHHVLVQYSSMLQRSWFTLLRKIEKANSNIESDKEEMAKLDSKLAKIVGNLENAQAIETDAKQEIRKLIRDLRESAKMGGSSIRAIGDGMSNLIWQLDKRKNVTESVRKRFARESTEFLNAISKDRLRLFDLLDLINDEDLNPAGDMRAFRNELKTSSFPQLRALGSNDAQVVTIAALARSSEEIFEKLSLRKKPELRSALKQALEKEDVELATDIDAQRKLAKKTNSTIRNAKLIGKLVVRQSKIKAEHRQAEKRVKRNEELINVGTKIADQYARLQENNWVLHGGTIKANLYTGKNLFLPPSADATREEILNSVKKFDYLHSSGIDWRETKQLQDVWLENPKNRTRNPFLWNQIKTQNTMLTKKAFNDEFYKVRTAAPWLYASLSKQAQRVGIPQSNAMVRMITQMQAHIDSHKNKAQFLGRTSQDTRFKLIAAIQPLMTIDQFREYIDSPAKRFLEQPDATIRGAWDSVIIAHPSMAPLFKGNFELFEKYMQAEIATFKFFKDVAAEIGLHVTDNRIYVPDYTMSVDEIADDKFKKGKIKGVHAVDKTDFLITKINGEFVVLVPIERAHFNLGTEGTFQIGSKMDYLEVMRDAMRFGKTHDDWADRMKAEVALLESKEDTDFNTLFDDDVYELFLVPLIRMTKQSAFPATKQAEAMQAWEDSNKSYSDFLNKLWDRIDNENIGLTKRQWIAEVGKTMAHYHRSFVSDYDKAKPAQMHNASKHTVERSGLDARKRTSYPAEWVQYKIGGLSNNLAGLAHIAFHAAMGKDGENFFTAIQQGRATLDTMRVKLKDTREKNIGKTEKELRIESEKALGGKEQLAIAQKAAEFERQLVSIENDTRNIFSSELGPFKDLSTLTESVTTMVLGTLNGPRSAITQFNDLYLSAGRTGFSIESAKTIAQRTGATIEGMFGSAMGAVGLEFWENNEYRRLAKEVMGIEMDVGTDFIEQMNSLIQDMGFEETLRTGSEDQVRAANSRLRTELGRYGFAGSPLKKVLRVINQSFSKGISKVDRDRAIYETFNVWAPFNFSVKHLSRSVIMVAAKRFDQFAMKATEYLKENSTNPKVFKDGDPDKGYAKGFSFEDVKDEIGFGALLTIGGVEVVNQQGKAFDYYADEVLAKRVGTTIEQVALDNFRGTGERHVDDQGRTRPYTLEQYRMITSTVSGDFTGDANQLTTRTPKSGTAEKLGLPLLGWTINRSQDFAQIYKTKDHEITTQSVMTGMVITAMALLPSVLAFSLFRDWFDETVMGKKSNLKPLNSEDWFVNGVERFTREGTMGMTGELVNLLVNSAAGGAGDVRTLSLDQRIFLANSFRNIMNTASTLINQKGTITYSTVSRPIIQNLGGNGALQWMQILGDNLGWDNPEVRHNERANMSNWLRSSGFLAGLEPRRFSGTTRATPITPWVTEMQLSAFQNDLAGFNIAKRKAIQASIDFHDETAEDARDRVRRSFNSRHPLRTAFRSAPSKSDVSKVLQLMSTRGADSVQQGLFLYNKYNKSIGNQEYLGSESRKKKSRIPISTLLDLGI